MQKLQGEFKNIPANASLVRSSISSRLNRDPSPLSAGTGLSVPGKVLTCNNPEVNLRQHTGGQNLRVSAIVYVPGAQKCALTRRAIHPTNKFVGFLEKRS